MSKLILKCCLFLICLPCMSISLSYLESCISHVCIFMNHVLTCVLPCLFMNKMIAYHLYLCMLITLNCTLFCHVKNVKKSYFIIRIIIWYVLHMWRLICLKYRLIKSLICNHTWYVLMIILSRLLLYDEWFSVPKITSMYKWILKHCLSSRL